MQILLFTGGLVTVSVPIRYKNSDYKLYEYRNLFFSWEQRTCTLDTSSRFVIKELKSNKAYSIADLDQDRCEPYLSRMCKVPPASDSAEAYCLTSLLSSSTVSQVILYLLLKSSIFINIFGIPFLYL